MSTAHRTVISLLAAAGLLVSGAAFADPGNAPSSSCGDHKKDVKKPQDDKKQPSPACGGECECEKKNKKGDKKNPS